MSPRLQELTCRAAPDTAIDEPAEPCLFGRPRAHIGLHSELTEISKSDGKRSFSLYAVHQTQAARDQSNDGDSGGCLPALRKVRSLPATAALSSLVRPAGSSPDRQARRSSRISSRIRLRRSEPDPPLRLLPEAPTQFHASDLYPGVQCPRTAALAEAAAIASEIREARRVAIPCGHRHGAGQALTASTDVAIFRVRPVIAGRR